MGIEVGKLGKGDKVRSYRNGKNVYQTVADIRESKETKGIRITLDNGNSITTTVFHQLWATLPVFGENLDKEETIVYLMYRKDLGYRVGITNKGYSKDSLDNISSRMISESGEKLWILDWEKARIKAHFKELSYSLEYGVPTCVFNGSGRGLDQNFINGIFGEFGKNGEKLLIDKGLSFGNPHWHAASSEKHGEYRNNITFVEHGIKGSIVTLEWTEEPGKDRFLSKLGEHGITVTAAKGDNRYRIRKWSNNNNQAFAFVQDLSALLDLTVSSRLSNSGIRVNLLTAGGLFMGMEMPVMGENGYKLEKISNVEKVEGSFSEIVIEDTSNLYLNGILVRN